MMPLIPVMLAINLPLGYLLCWYFKIRKFWQILLVGLGQYAASGFVLAGLLVFNDNSPQNHSKILNTLYLGGAGLLLFAIIAVPLILLYSWFLHWFFHRQNT